MAERTYPGIIPPPEGVVPDVNHPQTANQALLLGFTVTCAVLATAFFFMRMYVKVVRLKDRVFEDVTCAIAWVFFFAYCMSKAVGVYYGQGYHAWEITPEQYVNIRKTLYAGAVVYCPAALFTKLTLLLLIARVFAVRARVAKAIRTFMGFLVVVYIIIGMAKIFACSPIRRFWDHNAKGTCITNSHLFYMEVAVAVATDFIILVIPIPLTVTLRTTGWMKFKIVILLGIGGITIAVTTYRQWLSITYLKTIKDVTAHFSVIAITVLLELSIGLICSCLPVLSKLYSLRQASRQSGSAITPLPGWKLPFMRLNHSSHSAGPRVEDGMELSGSDSSGAGRGKFLSAGFVFGHGPAELNSAVGREEGWLVSQSRTETNAAPEEGGNKKGSAVHQSEVERTLP